MLIILVFSPLIEEFSADATLGDVNVCCCETRRINEFDICIEDRGMCYVLQSRKETCGLVEALALRHLEDHCQLHLDLFSLDFGWRWYISRRECWVVVTHGLMPP